MIKFLIAITLAFLFVACGDITKTTSDSSTEYIEYGEGVVVKDSNGTSLVYVLDEDYYESNDSNESD